MKKKNRKVHSQSVAMPTAMHFLKRHSWHWLRVTLSMMHLPSYLHAYVGFRFFWIVRRKKPFRHKMYLIKYASLKWENERAQVKDSLYSPHRWCSGNDNPLLCLHTQHTAHPCPGNLVCTLKPEETHYKHPTEHIQSHYTSRKNNGLNKTQKNKCLCS